MPSSTQKASICLAIAHSNRKGTDRPPCTASSDYDFFVAFRSVDTSTFNLVQSFCVDTSIDRGEDLRIPTDRLLRHPRIHNVWFKVSSRTFLRSTLYPHSQLIGAFMPPRQAYTVERLNAAAKAAETKAKEYAASKKWDGLTIECRWLRMCMNHRGGTKRVNIVTPPLSLSRALFVNCIASIVIAPTGMLLRARQ